MALAVAIRFGEPCVVVRSKSVGFKATRRPNRQNERYWAPEDPNIEVECSVQGRTKLMAWVGLIEGKAFVHWFDNNSSMKTNTLLNVKNREIAQNKQTC